MGVHLERGMLLYEQGRYPQAVDELRLELAENPDHPLAHTYLAKSLCELEQFHESTDEARQAVALAPDADWAHAALAMVYWRREYIPEAQESAEEAVRLDPGEPANHVLLGYIHCDCKRWNEALACAERALAVDAEHTQAANLRAMVLVKLGRKAEADDTLDGALTHDPENALTHANRGWALLERGQPKEAMEHFREALRLNPEMEWARAGIVEALKAGTIIYRPFLAYFLWISKFHGKTAMLIVIGFYVLYQVLGNFSRSHPQWAPYVEPILIVYIVFAISSWLAHPLFDLLLRLHPFGKLALSREQIVASNWIGTSFFLALGGLVAYFLWPANVGPANPTISDMGLVFALLFGFILFPLTGVFSCPRGWPRWVMILVTFSLFVIGSIPATWVIVQSTNVVWFELSKSCPQIFLWGCMLSTWLINGLASVRVKK